MLQTLLVDDDILSLNRLQTYLSGLPFIQVAGQLQDGLSAIEYLSDGSHTVDIIILDMEMPGAGGLEVAQMIARKQLPVTILAISNYDNFEYVKPILQAGAFDYLLKHELSPNLLKSKLTEIMQHISQQQLRQRQWDNMCLLSKQQYLRDLVRSHEITEDNHRFFASDPLLSGSRHVIACLQITNYSNIYLSTSDGRHEKVIDTVLHFCETYFLSLQRGIMTHVNYGEFLILLSFPHMTSEAAILQTAMQDLNLLKHNLERYLSIHTLMEQQLVFDSVRNILPYYLKIQHQLQIKPFSSASPGQDTRKQDGTLLSITQEQELLDCLIHLNEKRARSTLIQIFDCIKESHISLMQLQRLIGRLTEIMQQALLAAPAQENAPQLGSITNILDIDSLRDQFIRFYQSGIRCLSLTSLNQYSSLIQKGINYIHQNYQSDLSLSDISMHCGVTEVYFSRAFKEAMGMPFTKYLNSYRVKIASQLLLRSQDSLKKIAEDSGFQSYNYFLTVFKTYTGATPVQFRENRADAT